MNEATESVLRHFVAMERDRDAGYIDSELNKPPEEVVVDAIEVLEAHGRYTDELLPEHAQERMGIKDAIDGMSGSGSGED